MGQFLATDKAFAISLASLGIVIGWLFNLLVSGMNDAREQTRQNAADVRQLKAEVVNITKILDKTVNHKFSEH